MHPEIERWLGLSEAERDVIYRQTEPGNLPMGITDGTAIPLDLPLASKTAPVVAALARVFAWQGKIFDLYAPDRQSGVAVNRVTPFSVPAVVAKVYRTESWMDGKPTIVIDYSQTSLLARQIRDEIREVLPGVWMGKVWWQRQRVLDFALHSPG